MRPKTRRRSFLRELIEVVAIAVLIAFVIQTWVFETFVVDGDSMRDTLHHGDRVIVNKFIYRLRPPEAGDIVVFPYPADGDRDLIKRVVATPGEVVEVRDGQVHVNGRVVEENYLTRPDHQDFAPQKVPPRSVFVMGDNRGNSDDSRAFGMIHFDDIRGKTWAIFWPLSSLCLLGVAS